MDPDAHGLCQSLTVWLRTFNTGAPCDTLQDLSSGLAMAHALHQIDPVWFDEGWLGRIKEDVEDSRRLKMSNLKKVLQKVVQYYGEVLVQEISEFPLPDLSRVAERSDHVELGRLLQLILGCAVICEKKEEYVQVIMTLEESVQHVVMTAIQELIESTGTLAHVTGEPPGTVELQLKKALEEVAELKAEKDELVQRCQELDLQVTILQEERCCLLESDVLGEQVGDPDSSPQGRQSQLQLQLEQLQEENFRLEATKDDFRIRCQELKQQLQEAQRRNEGLIGLAKESRFLRDELDVLRSSSDRAAQLQASVDSYRKKLEDLSDLRKQVKSLDERNLKYMEEVEGLEEELRKASVTRGQLETFKSEVQKLRTKLADESRRADGLVFDMKQLEEKHESLLKEKERLIIERDFLREANEELQCVQVQQEQLRQAGSPDQNNLAAELLPVEYREKLASFQQEVRMLRMQLEEVRQCCADLDAKNRQKEERIRELELREADLQKALIAQQAEAEREAQLLLLSEPADQDGKHTVEIFIEQRPAPEDTTALNVQELLVALQEKDNEMRQMENRYRIYLERARDVMRTIDSKLFPTEELQLLQNQLSEKEKRIQTLERECEQVRLWEREEKMMVTAWYNKSLTLQRAAVETRLGPHSTSPTPSPSLLAQQRQAPGSAGHPGSLVVLATGSR